MTDSKIVELRAYCDRLIADLALLEKHGWKAKSVKKEVSKMRRWLTEVNVRPTQKNTKVLEMVHTNVIGHTLTLDSLLGFLLTHDPSHIIAGQYIDLLQHTLKYDRYEPRQKIHENYGMMLNVHNFKTWQDQRGLNIKKSKTRLAKKVLKQLDKLNIPVYEAELVRSDPV